MTQTELTAEIFEQQRAAIKAKGGSRMVAVFTLTDGKEVRLPAVDGKFDSVFKVGTNGLEMWEHGTENPTPEEEATKVTYVTPHALRITPFSVIEKYSIEYATLRKMDVTPESEAVTE